MRFWAAGSCTWLLGLRRSDCKRSAGPLWGLLKDCLRHLKAEGFVSTAYQELLYPNFFDTIDMTVKQLANQKHDKLDTSNFDLRKPIEILANISQKVFSQNIFGFFENVQKEKFGTQYTGLFRHAHGNSLPFITRSKYQGEHSFSTDEPILYNMKTGTGLSLEPLLFWESCEKHKELGCGHCYIFDKQEKVETKFTFKAASYPSCSLEVTDNNKYSALGKKMLELQKCDMQVSLLNIGKLEKVPED